MSAAFPPPRVWLPALAAHLDRALAGASIEGIAGGPVWLSLRVDGRYLWFLSTPALRLASLDERPVPRAWLDLLERHKRSPFAVHLRDRRIERVQLLCTEDGLADGISLLLGDDGQTMVLGMRFWPRPGAIWLLSADGDELAQAGHMDGPPLVARDVRDPRDATGAARDVTRPTAAAAGDPSPEPAALADHAATARAALRAYVLDLARRRLRQALTHVAKKQARLVEALARELEQARGELALRGQADVLAAHLHEVRPGQSEVELTGFDGEPVRIALDPARSPAANLDHLYRRAGKVERKVAALGQRVDAARIRQAELRAAREELERLDAGLGQPDAGADLDALRALAQKHGIELVPAPASSRERAAPQRRLPYRRYRLPGGWEVRVGRSASDNDALTQRHSTGKDLWLHAAGVEGSHVVLRTEGRPAPPAVIEAAAQLAAQFSRARHSETVAVLVTERRHVRKPRGTPPGTVIAERGKTIFVSPRMPHGCTRAAEED
jgi:hypothetical protein